MTWLECRSRPSSHGRKSAVAALGLLLLVAPVSAQDVPNRPLSPEDCVRIALDRNYDLLIAASQAEQADGQAKQALGGVLPSISANAQYAHSRSNQGGAFLVGVTPVPNNGKSQSDARSATVSLDQPIFDWSNWEALKSARRNAGASHEDVRTQEIQVTLDVKVRYYEYLKADRLLEVRLESVELREGQLARAQTLFDVGSVARNDVLQSQVNLQQARLEEIQARNQADLERSRLAQLMGLPVDTPLDIIDDLDVSTAMAVPDSASMWAEAMRDRPDLKSARLRVLAGETNLGSARAKRYPSLFGRIVGAYSDASNLNTSFVDTTLNQDQSAPFDIQTQETDSESSGWDFTAGISWSIFDGAVTEGRVKEAKASLVQTEDRLAQIQLAANLELKEALLGIRAANQSIATSDQQVALAEENTKLAEERYQLGSGTLLELEEAQVSLIEARRQLVEALALLKVAEATLDKARGRVPR